MLVEAAEEASARSWRDEDAGSSGPRLRKSRVNEEQGVSSSWRAALSFASLGYEVESTGLARGRGLVERWLPGCNTILLATVC